LSHSKGQRNALFVAARKSVAPPSIVSTWFWSCGSWQVSHRKRTFFEPGDLIFYDSRYPLDCNLLRNWSDINLQLSEQFVRKWLPHPGWLGGRRIARDARWGRVLASYVAQLSPEFVVQAPLPQAVLIDQLGALLALTANELGGRNAGSAPAERSVRDRVHDHIRQRCPDRSLQAADVASSLDISKRTLHRALAACGETFGAMLIQARLISRHACFNQRYDATTAEMGGAPLRRLHFSSSTPEYLATPQMRRCTKRAVCSRLSVRRVRQ
jgi:hypothetical protein